MLLQGVPRKDTVVLADTNVVMEAVRTRCWNAVSGGVRVETVEECRDEALRGDRGRPGYLPVSTQDLARIRAVHPVSDVERVTFAMAYADAENMDAGERDLFAPRVFAHLQGRRRVGPVLGRQGVCPRGRPRSAGTTACSPWARSRRPSA